ncbi:MAG: Ig-like domain-containing protein, partial [Bacteroidales bacterium]|nr:Ig-like domain-containing protein [Bacteroidales bacterium]
MKKVLFFMLLLVIGLGAMAQQRTRTPEPQWTSVISHSPEAFQTQLISSTENSIMVNVQVPGFYTTAVTTPHGEAYVITVPKSVSTAQAGEPDMPMTGIPVMIGDKANMNVRVINAQYIDYENMEVAPSKGDFPRSIDPATVPYTYGECYSQDAFFPASNVGLYEPYIIRDFRGQNIVIYPFAYNPVTKTLRVYYNMTVEMYKMDDHGTNVIATRHRGAVKMDSDFKSVYQRHFINYEESSAKYTPVDEEGDLLIICYDNFISSMTDFVNWKKTRGINTTIVGTSTAGSTYSAIKNYIQSQYNANNNLTHVLLVGDVAQIPGYTYSGASGYEGKGDNPYGQVVGNDIYNDIFIGRFSASSAAQVTTQVNRIITYEKELSTSATWCQNGLGISTSEGSGGHNNEDDYQHIENLRTDLLNYGYSTVYQDYASVSGYPSSTTTTISNHINSGVGIINYCNHGEETGWQSHYYMNSNVNALTNNNKLPFIFSVACLVGKYDYSSGDCFGETWMHATNGSTPTGAIGGMFSYISQPWIPPMWAQDEFVDILVESYSNNIKHTLGGAAINGLFGIFDNYSTSNASAVGTYQAWVLYGDPTLMLRTKTPQAMTITHNGTITIGSSAYTVTVSNGNGAVATITDANHNILGKATVSNGTATVNLNSSNLTAGSELTLCVFGFNKVTKLGTIQVVGGTQYNISVTQPQHGTISAPAQAYANSTVTLTANPETGYCLSSWTVKKGNTNITVTNNQFTMPEGNVTVTATFVQGMQVTLANVQHGTISADPLYALQGMTINLMATPAEGYEFNSWVVYKTGDPNTTVTVTGNSFTMPNYPVTVSANFVLAPTDLTVYNGTSTNQYIPMYGYYFDNYTKSECIIPASQLTAMNGSAISAITFYPSSVGTTNSTWTSTSQTVFLKEVSGTTLGGSFSGTTGSTTVKQGLLEMPTAGEPYTITFDAPYTYNGGNLLIGVYNTAKGSYNKVEWYGTSNLTSGVSAYGNNSSSLNSVTYNAQSFLPKTTFTYLPSTTPYISLAPNSATVLTGFTETLTASYGNVTGTPSITYSSSNTSVATVSGSGTTVTVTAVAAGTATITATMVVDGIPYTATCAVTVENPSYCTPNPTSRDGQGITSLTFGSGDYVVNNSSSNGLPSSSPYYGDYTSMVGGYEAEETATVTITYSTGSSTVYSYGTVIWVDWNKNYTFEDNEIVYTGTSA